jgi:hypothetical protein
MSTPRRITGTSVKILRLEVGKESYVHTALVILSSVNCPVYITRCGSFALKLCMSQQNRSSQDRFFHFSRNRVAQSAMNRA